MFHHKYGRDHNIVITTLISETWRLAVTEQNRLTFHGWRIFKLVHQAIISIIK